MPISVSHLWKPTPRDLHAIAENAMAAAAILNMPLIRRRAAMVAAGYPRHLYKFRRVPDEREGDARDQLERMLLLNELYAATSDTFNDPFDAQADYRIEQNGDALRDLVFRYLKSQGASDDIARAIVKDPSLDDSNELAAMLKVNHQKLLQQLGICSLAAAPHDPLLWAHYAQNHRGIAIQYQPSQDPQELQPHPVEYSETYPIVDNFFDRKERDIFSPLLRKSLSWKYEMEWRVLRADLPNRAFHVRPEALTGVLLGMRIPGADRDYIRDLVTTRDRRYGTKTRLFQAEAAPGEYRVRMRRLR